MSKVLSTKLAADQMERFDTAAKQQGLSKAGLLKRLAQEYLDKNNKLDRFSGVSEPNQNSSSSKEGQLSELLTEQERTVRALQNRLALMANRSEVDRIAKIVEKHGKQLKLHDHWFNPRGIDEVTLCICGGPIADVEKRLDSLETREKAKLRL